MTASFYLIVGMKNPSPPKSPPCTTTFRVVSPAARKPGMGPRLL